MACRPTGLSPQTLNRKGEKGGDHHFPPNPGPATFTPAQKPASLSAQ